MHSRTEKTRLPLLEFDDLLVLLKHLLEAIDAVKVHIHGLCVWVFDILSHSGKDQRLKPLVARRAKLKTLMDRVDSQVIRYSETFADPLPLLAACAARDLTFSD